MATRSQRPLTATTTRPARLRGALAGVPTAAWACALVAFLNAAAWSIVTPAFQVPDEPVHYAYTEYLVAHGRPPAAQPADLFSSSEQAAMAGLKFTALRFAPDDGTIWSAAEQRVSRSALQQGGDRADGNGGAREVGSEPPLFYALQSIPYRIESGGTVLDRLQLMRLLSALFAGVTVLFVFLFLREALPAIPETWTVGALGVAFAPMFGFISGGVNSDALLYAASAALFYLIARGFRRGAGIPLAAAIGAALAAGLMTKFNAIGFVPGTAVALLALGVRREGGLRPRALTLAAVGLGVAAAPMLLEMALNATVWERPVIGANASNYNTAALHPSLGHTLSYLWQFYLVPLPGMTHYVTAVPFRDLWVTGFVGSFGWVDTTFSSAVIDAALVPIALLAVLGARTAIARRHRVRARLGELLSYAALALGLMGFVAVASLISELRFGGGIAQVRYLFPLLSLYGALLALAARGAGRRWAPVLGTAIVVLAIAHDLFAQMLVVARYYA